MMEWRTCDKTQLHGLNRILGSVFTSELVPKRAYKLPE